MVWGFPVLAGIVEKVVEDVSKAEEEDAGMAKGEGCGYNNKKAKEDAPGKAVRNTRY
jgi:hypothetical protein